MWPQTLEKRNASIIRGWRRSTSKEGDSPHSTKTQGTLSLTLHGYISLPRLPKQNTKAAWQRTQQVTVFHRSGSCKCQDQDGSQVGSTRGLFCLTDGQLPVILGGTKIAGFFFPFSSFKSLFMGGTCAPTHTCSSEDSLLELVLSLHCVSSSYGTQVVSLDSKPLTC